MARWVGFEVWKERREELSGGGGEIKVRWGLPGDEGHIADLLELNGIPCWVAFEERFVVAVGWDGEVLAALRYRTLDEKLLVGLLVVDPWVEERHVARILYEGLGSLARCMGAGEVLAVSCEDYPREAGYRRQGRFCHLDIARSFESFGELPEGHWRRVLALLSFVTVPFFRVSRDRETL